MKLPVIRHLQRNNEKLKLEHSIEVLESFTEHRSVTEEEMDIIGELISNLCGAVEVHNMVEDGTPEKEACNNFMQTVMGSVDR